MTVLDSFKLDGKVALVTGGAGLFGRQIVIALAEAGAKTYVASRNLEALEAQAEALRGEGLDVTAMQLDQADEASVNALRDRLISDAGHVDVLVNNAVARPMKSWSDGGEAFAKSMAINATGLYLMTRAFGDAMAERGRGSIINIGSIQGMVGADFSLYEGLGMDAPPDYYFHKGGLVQLTRYTAARLGPKGVRVNCLSPGGFFNNQNPTFVERYNQRTFLNRMANDDDLKGAIVFLASDASAYITGTNLPIDAGYTAK
ncbi:SDR family oxidoreductase [Phycisphaerales bacterium AB-hyl4]|uniref:SDR family oxidoreductase n=1 Tax=Natronomicrosphaera hydrolytica TaxID=3242702 RepID=A0ABV4U8T8_9BACT